MTQELKPQKVTTREARKIVGLPNRKALTVEQYTKLRNEWVAFQNQRETVFKKMFKFFI